jgi:uncharacterized protein
MRKIFSFLCLSMLSLLHAPAADTPKKALVVTVTTEFRHSSIPTAERILAKLGQESGVFTVDYVQQQGTRPEAPKKPTPPKAPATDKSKSRYESLLEQYNFDVEQAKYEAALAKFEAQQQSLTEAQKTAAAQWDQSLKENLAKMGPESLKNYKLVIFANTTGNLPLPNRDAFIQWVRDGGAFVGMHSASDTFHHYKPYIEMLGGEFETHGAQVAVECINKDPKHPATKHLGQIYDIGRKNEEIYIIKSYNPAVVRELLVLDRHPNTLKPGHHPIAWCREFGKGKVFYTALGHNESVWEREDYQNHILGGIKWALGLESGDATQSK